MKIEGFCLLKMCRFCTGSIHRFGLWSTVLYSLTLVLNSKFPQEINLGDGLIAGAEGQDSPSHQTHRACSVFGKSLAKNGICHTVYIYLNFKPVSKVIPVEIF
jgi:hypothetical protein